MEKKLMLSYLAGFFDGEGCIRINKQIRKRKGNKSPEYTGVVLVDNTNQKVLKLFQKEFGGSIFGCRKKDNWKISYEWKITNDKALEFCKIIKPYLLMKQEQAGNLITLQETMGSWKKVVVPDRVLSKREELYLQNKELNRRGRR